MPDAVTAAVNTTAAGVQPIDSCFAGPDMDTIGLIGRGRFERTGDPIGLIGHLIVDTAGRQHTHSGLMDELKKIRRVIAKADATAPHEVLMVLDAGTGQNALAQLKHFGDAVNVTGIALTKLDGTAKGGILIAIAKQSGLPIRYIGVGEKPDDLQEFDPQAYVDALLPETG